MLTLLKENSKIFLIIVALMLTVPLSGCGGCSNVAQELDDDDDDDFDKKKKKSSSSSKSSSKSSSSKRK